MTTKYFLTNFTNQRYYASAESSRFMSESSKNKLTRLERILQATTEGWWEWDIETDHMYHSPGWFAMLGFTQEEIIYSKLWEEEQIHPDDRFRVIYNQQLFIRHDDPWEQEFRLRHKDGHYIWVLSRGSVLYRSADGKPLLVGGLHINITPQKQIHRLHEDLKTQENLVQGILKVSLSSLALYDFIAKRMSYASGQIMKKMGYREEEFADLSHNLYERVIHPDDKIKLETHLAKLNQSLPGQIFECLLRFQNKEGQYHTIMLRDSVFARDDQGVPREIICSAIDVTHYLRLKAKMDENMKFIREMSFKNSHEMRAPVATMLGLVHLMKQELHSPAAVTEMVNYLEQTVTKMDEVIRDLTNTLNDKMKRG
jgi:PAS domain S-box-containing protein